MKDQGLENETDPDVQPDRDSNVILGAEQPKYNTKQPNKASRLAAEYLQLDDAARDEFVRITLHPEDNPPPPSDGWEPITVKEARSPQPPINYAVDGIFMMPSLNIVYGAPGTMKSFLMQDLAVCVALGKDWLTPAKFKSGGHSVKTSQGAVIWADFDMGKSLIIQRLRALADHYEATDDVPVSFYSFPSPGLNASDSASVANLAARSMGANMIIIDNLGTISGGVEENSSGMIPVMANLRWLAQTTGACVIVIHHQRKTAINGGKGRAGDALRGHSSIEGSIDLALQVEREPYSSEVTVKSTKTRNDEVPPFTAYFAYDKDPDGNLIKAGFFSVEPEDTQSGYAVEREIKHALEAGPLNQAALWQTVKAELPDVGKNRIVDKIKQMEDAGALIAKTGPRFQLIYSLPSLPASRSFPELPGKVEP